MNFLASFLDVLSYGGYVIIALLVLLVMITAHEFGHYIVGKIFHFGIDEFAIGFGPTLYSKQKKNGEVFSVRLLPLGGFCSFKGEDKDSKEQDSFNNKKPYQRILVLIAGAFMNYLLAVILICLMFGFYGQSAYRVNKTDSSIENQQFQVDDVILKANGKRIYLATDFINALDGKKKDDTIDFLVLRSGEEQTVSVILNQDANFYNIEDTNTILTSLGLKELYSVQIKENFFKTVGNSFEYSGRLAGTIFTVFHQLFTGRLGINSMGGTITTISVTSKAIQTGGLKYLLYISSFIGVNLAVVNLLPIPALDGARIVFCLIEWITKKPVNRKIEAIIHTVGFILLMTFAIFVDVQQIF